MKLATELLVKPSQSLPNPLVSVVIRTYRSPDTLFALIDSLSAQDFDLHRLEVLIVWTSSDQDTGKAIKLLEENHQFLDLRFIAIDQNMATAGRNKGILESRGEYALVTDDDVVLDSQTIRRGIEVMSGRPEVAAVTFPAMPAGFNALKGVPLIYRVHYLRSLGIVASVGSPGMVTFYRKRILLSTGLYREDMGPPITIHEDWELGSRIRRLGYKILIDGTTPQLHLEGSIESHVNRKGKIGNRLVAYARSHLNRDANSMEKVLMGGPVYQILETAGYIIVAILFLALMFFDPIIGLSFAGIVGATVVLYNYIAGYYRKESLLNRILNPLLLFSARILRSVLFLIFVLAKAIPRKLRKLVVRPDSLSPESLGADS